MIRFIAVNDSEKFNVQLIDEVENMLKSREYNVEVTQYEENFWEIDINLGKKSIYCINFEIETFEKHEQLNVYIQAKVVNDEYDDVLEEIKILVKGCILSNWKKSKVIWIADQQSVYLANLLYKSINIVENHLRMLINRIMNAHLGIEWWNDIAPSKLKEKYDARRGHYKRIVPSFRDVSDYLISIDVDDLIELMKLEIKDIPEDSIDEIKPSMIEGNVNKCVAILQKKMFVKLRLWDQVYSRYFNEEFLELWDEFYKDRNHIAHNKLIDKSAYNNILSVVEKLDGMLIQAEEIFDKDVISEERKEQIKIFKQEQEEEYREIEEERMQYEAGIEIKDTGKIFEIFEEYVTMFVDNVIDDMLCRDDISIQRNELIEDDGEVDLVYAESDLHDCKLIIKAISQYNAEAGGESTVEIKFILNEEVLGEGMFVYINGDASYDEEQGYYMPETENEFGEVNIDKLEEIIKSSIEERMPDLESRLEEILEDKSEEILDYTPVYHLTCPSCYAEDSISCDEVFFTVGRCYRCGEEFNISKCKICGEYFINDAECDECEQCSDKK
nr:hypothetical protein [uncultured Cellulosilyticum sp.]